MNAFTLRNIMLALLIALPCFGAAKPKLCYWNIRWNDAPKKPGTSTGTYSEIHPKNTGEMTKEYYQQMKLLIPAKVKTHTEWCTCYKQPK